MKFRNHLVTVAMMLALSGCGSSTTESTNPLSDNSSDNENIDNSNNGGNQGNSDESNNGVADGSPDNGNSPSPEPGEAIDNTPITLGFAEAESNVSEDALTHDVMLSISRVSPTPITLSFTVTPETAEPKKDFDLVDGTITIEPGIAEAKLTLPLVNDKFYEDNESLMLSIESLQGAEMAQVLTHKVMILNDDIPTEEDALHGVPRGAEMLKIVCDRMTAQGVINKVTETFCGDELPVINNIKDFQRALGFEFDPNAQGRNDNGANGNPGFAITGHSSSLVMQFTNAINPRAIIFTPPNGRNPLNESFTAIGFVRGEQFVEVISAHFNPNDPNDPKNGDLEFYLFNFEQVCNEDHSCTLGDLLTDKIESNWTGWTLLHEEELKNTILDCRQCHQPEGINAQKNLLMQELNNPWTHWFRNNRDAGQALIADYVAAHGEDEEYAGIPGAFVVSGSDPANLEDLIRGNGFGNGFDATTQQGRFDGGDIEDEVVATSPQQPEDNTVPGVSQTWQNLYEQNVRGEIIQIPYHDAKVTDPVKLQQMTDAYVAYKAGDITELPDIRKAFKDGDELRDIGFKVQAGLDGEGIMIQACTQCHNDQLDQSISRAKFNVDLTDMSVAQLKITQDRVNLPTEHLLVMPPTRFRTLDADERKLLTDYLQTVIDQKLAAEAAANVKTAKAKKKTQ
ncbi:MAG: Calx-beta domain-containing protein [Pseudomonadota bacterium]